MRRYMDHIGSDPDEQPLHWGKLGAVLAGSVVAVFASAYILEHQGVARAFVYLAGVVVIGIFSYLISTGQRNERAGLIAALVLTVQSVFYFIFYQQMSTSLALFALRNVDPSFVLFGTHLWDWSPAQFQAFNPIWIFILSPVLAWAYTHAGKAGKDISIAAKFALGFLIVAAGFFIYGASGHLADAQGKVSSWLMVWGYGAIALGDFLRTAMLLLVMVVMVLSRWVNCWSAVSAWR